jgi:hypothetical protein
MRTWHLWVRPWKLKDKVSSFLCLYNDKTKNLLLPNIGISNVFRNNDDDDRVWICHEQDRSWSASSSKSKIRFVGSPKVLHCEGHSSIRSATKVNEHLMEILFDKLSNRSGLTSISCWQGLQIIKTFCRCFGRVLRRHRGLVIHTWVLGPSWSTPQEDGEHLRDAQGCPPPWPPPYEASKVVQAKFESQSKSSSSPSRAPGAAFSKMDTQVTYGLLFQWSTYGWKYNLIR